MIHTEVKSRQCKHCDKRFYWSRECKRHELSHAGVKPYKCSFCDNIALDNHQIASIMNLHIQEIGLISASIVICALQDDHHARNMN